MNRLTMFGIWILCLFGSAFACLRMLTYIIVGSDRAWRMAVAFDRIDNAACGGSDKETISSRAYRAQQEGRPWGCILCKLLDRVQKDHCKNSAGV